MTQLQAVFSILSDGQKHYAFDMFLETMEMAKRGELKHGSMRIGARVFDLRQRGFEIDSDSNAQDQSIWWYQLKTPNDQIDFENLRPKPRVSERAVLI